MSWSSSIKLSKIGHCSYFYFFPTVDRIPLENISYNLSCQSENVGAGNEELSSFLGLYSYTLAVKNKLRGQPFALCHHMKMNRLSVRSYAVPRGRQRLRYAIWQQLL